MAWIKSREHRKLAGRPWRRLREQVMIRDKWLCQSCLRSGRLTTATEVDHIKALASGGDDKLSNLEGICSNCHTEKTLIDSGMKPKVAIGQDGWPT